MEAVTLRRALLAAIVPLAFLSASKARAAPVGRHVVRIDVLEIATGRTPRARHFDLVVDEDGSLAARKYGLYRVDARWSERQRGKPTITLRLDRDGSSAMHFVSHLRPTLGVPQFRFGTSSKGSLTEVFVTVL